MVNWAELSKYSPLIRKLPIWVPEKESASACFTRVAATAIKTATATSIVLANFVRACIFQPSFNLNPPKSIKI
jgi:hypothetical protein